MTVQLRCERLLAEYPGAPELVLLHGWGSSPAVWRALLAHLRPWANLNLVYLPGMGGAADEQVELEALLDALSAWAPPGAAWIGWSLGGQLASLLAARKDVRAAALVTLASNPCFIATADWPGMALEDIQGLNAILARSPGAALRRFEALQLVQLGQRGSGALRRELADSRGLEEPGLARGLAWLETLDTRAVLQTLTCPQLHLLAEDDHLIPGAVAEAIVRELPGPAAAGRLVVTRLPGMGHVLPLQCPSRLAQELASFLRPLLPGSAGEEAGPALPPKEAVAASFSRSAERYDSVAQLQRDVGQGLLEQLAPCPAAEPLVLDLGCGTAYFQDALLERYPGARYLGLDLAPGMLDYARRKHPRAFGWLAGDAEQLPVASASVDVVFSSLAIQWCARPAAVFAELARVLRPGGLAVFSTLGPETLWELRSAWAEVDEHAHVNDFLPPEALEHALGRHSGLSMKLQRETHCLHYEQAGDLLRELKELGAHNMNSGRRQGLGGRAALRAMIAAYERFRQDGQLPASYDVVYGRMERL